MLPEPSSALLIAAICAGLARLHLRAGLSQAQTPGEESPNACVSCNLPQTKLGCVGRMHLLAGPALNILLRPGPLMLGLWVHWTATLDADEENP